MKFDEQVFPILEFIANNPNPADTRDFAFLHAVEFYRNRNYFEAHEVWEFQWKKETGNLKLFLQALIQISVAMNKLYVNINLTGALSQANLALEKIKKLEYIEADKPNNRRLLSNLIVNLNLLVYLLSNNLDYGTYIPPEIFPESYLIFL